MDFTSSIVFERPSAPEDILIRSIHNNTHIKHPNNTYSYHPNERGMWPLIIILWVVNVDDIQPDTSGHMPSKYVRCLPGLFIGA